MGGFRPLDTRCWEALLEFLGYECARVKGSHHQWKKKNHRTIPVWGAKKQIPALFIHTNCRNFNWTPQEVYAWADENC